MTAAAEAIAQTQLAADVAHWREHYRDNPGAWWIDYARTLVNNPVALAELPKSASLDADGTRTHRPNEFMTLRDAQRGAREHGWGGKLEGWDEYRMQNAIRVDRRIFHEWYDPWSDRLEQLARTLQALGIYGGSDERPISLSLLDQGDAIERQVSAWVKSGAVVWLPWIRYGDGYPTVLHAWQRCAQRWRGKLS